MTILVTGAAGFIGYHVASALLDRGDRVIGVDNFNTYYDPALKEARAARLEHTNFTLHRIDISDRPAMHALVHANPEITEIIHLAAQAGVRYSMIDPYAYVQSNVLGHLVMLEAARLCPALRHFVYASSSSVYGLGSTMPLDEAAPVMRPTSVYAATKVADELLSHAYAHLYQLPQTGLRFFTVYGPWGRPDMAYYAFAKAMVRGEPICLYEAGALKRDFTYIDDIVAGVLAILPNPPPPDQPRVLNIGNHRSEPVTRLVTLLERALGTTAILQTSPRPPADVVETCASTDRLTALTGYVSRMALNKGIPRFVEWFRSYETPA